MSDLRVVREFRRALLAAEPRRRLRRRWMLPALATLFVGAGIATAATGNFPIGAPIKPRAGHSATPHIDRPVKGSGQVEAIRTPDPDGGPPWGVREFKTARGFTCEQVGRVVDGRLGLIGDDGKFHEVPLTLSICFGGGPDRPPRPTDGIVSSGGGRPTAAGDPAPGGFSRHPCTEGTGAHASFDPSTVICDKREVRWIANGTTGPRVVAIELVGRGVRERYPVVDGHYLIVRRGDEAPGVVTYSVFRDGHRRRESSTPHARPGPEPADARVVRRARMRARPAAVGPHGLVTVSLRAPAAAEQSNGDWYDVVLAGPPGCPRQGRVRFTIATVRGLPAGAPVRFGIRPPGPSLDAPRAWCTGTYTGSVVFRSRTPVGRFGFRVR